MRGRMGEDKTQCGGEQGWRFSGLGEERLVRVSTARPVLVDEEAIMADFPALQTVHPSGETGATLGTWLVDKAGLVSVAQLASTAVNTEVRTVGPARVGYRPARYGRATIVPFVSSEVSPEVSLADPSAPNHEGLGSGPRDEAGEGQGDALAGGGSGGTALWLDVKGVGVAPDRRPAPGYHTTGLLRLDDALEEYLWARLIDRILVRSGAPIRALPIYGVIDLGFDIHLQDVGADAPAGLLVRRAHARPPLSDLPFAGTHLHRICLSAELLLRSYGITSSGDETLVLEEDERDPQRVRVTGLPGLPQGVTLAKAVLGSGACRGFPLEMDHCNIQTALPGRDGLVHLVDFGQFRWRAHFARPLLSTVADQPAAFGGVVWEDRSDFPQPRADQLVPDSYWGSRQLAPGEEASSYLPDQTGVVRIPSLICNQMVRALRLRELGPREVKRQVDTLIENSLCDRACP